MHHELADYEVAFDGQPPRRGLEASWALLRRSMRRHRRLRQLQVAGAIIYTLVGVEIGIRGHLSGWGFAVHGLLVATPNRLRSYRDWLTESSEVEQVGDAQTLCAKEAGKRADSLMASALVQGLLALTFLATGLICLAIDRNPRPGLGAGVIVLAWAAFKVKVLFPRAYREQELLGGE